MRLDFNVLWVEDQPSQVHPQVETISARMRKEGFRLETQFANSVLEAKDFLHKDIFGDHIDLVLMDYDLGDGPNGDEGLEVVRDTFSFKDVLFYSAYGVGALKKAVKDGDFQGVFYSDRLGLPDTVMGIFDTLVKKVIDIDHSRGIVMGATSEIDNFVNDSLLECFQSGDDDTREATLKKISKHLAEIKTRFLAACEKAESADEPETLFSLHGIYTSSHRLRLLRNLLKRLNPHDKDTDQKMAAYADGPMIIRNDMAHLTVERNGFSRTIRDREGKELTIQDMRELRVALLEHHERFENVLKSLRDGKLFGGTQR